MNLNNKHRFPIKALVFYSLNEFVPSNSEFWLRNVNSHLHINFLSYIQESTEFGLVIYLNIAERFKDVASDKNSIPYILTSIS